MATFDSPMYPYDAHGLSVNPRISTIITQSQSTQRVFASIESSEHSQHFKDLIYIIMSMFFVVYPRNYIYYLIMVLSSHLVFAMPQFKLISENAGYYENYGDSVSIYSDYALVGAGGDDDSAQNAGSVYVFKRNDESWTETALLTPNDTNANDWFGASVSMYNGTALIGAHVQGNADTGACYVFENVNESWIQTTKLVPNNLPNYATFGFSVSLYNQYALIGAPAYSSSSTFGSAYVYERVNDVWNDVWKFSPNIDDGDDFGYSVSICAEYALIGAPGDSTLPGKAYISEKINGAWSTSLMTLSASDESANINNGFGGSVAISSEYAVVGARTANDNGTVYIFERYGLSPGWWEETAKIIGDNDRDYFGKSVSVYNEYISIGAYGVGNSEGAVYIYTSTGNSEWTLHTELRPQDAANYDSFGSSVSLYKRYILVGAPGADREAAYIDTLYSTLDPTAEPTADPTTVPSADPTSDPVADPTFDPTTDPTTDPTLDPITKPTSEPTLDPTDDPTAESTTGIPTLNPTTDPTNAPTSNVDDAWVLKPYRDNCPDGYTDIDTDSMHYGEYCQRCGSNLAGTGGRCFECGTLQEPNHSRTDCEFSEPWWLYAVSVFGTLLSLLALCGCVYKKCVKVAGRRKAQTQVEMIHPNY